VTKRAEPYPDAVESEGQPQPCLQCRKPTLWVEANFEEFICSEPCYDEAWSDYMSAKHR
jgi:hypothetical protein